MAWMVATQFLMYAIGWGLCSLLVREQRSSVAHWSLFMALLGIGFVLTTQRGEPRTGWAYGGANFCFTAGFVVLRRGMERFMGVAPADREHVLTLVVFGALFVHLGPGEENAAWRVLLAYGAPSWVLARTAVALQGSFRAEYGKRMAIVLATPVAMVLSVFCARFVQQAMQPGVSLEMHRYTEANRGLLYAYGVMAAAYNFGFVALLTLRYVRRLRELTLHDPLTGLLNRRALDTELQREWSRLQRDGAPFALLALDLDHFKRVNDRHGHLVGDEVLAQTAQRLRDTVRGSDLVARTGGEEFVVLMPGIDDAGARMAAERLRAAVAGTPFAVSAGPLPLSVSVGVATVCQPGSGPRDALQRADRALYAAKEGGRDRVVMAA